MSQTVRNVAIILLLAAGVDLLPHGGDAANTVLAALSMTFFALIAWMIYRVYRDQEDTIATLTDGRKAGMFGAVGAIALLIVGADKFDFAGGILLWLALMAGCLAAIFLIWREATTYS